MKKSGKLDKVISSCVESSIKSNFGNLSKVAFDLGINRPKLYRLIERHKLNEVLKTERNNGGKDGI